jgi:hypothetical protein
MVQAAGAALHATDAAILLEVKDDVGEVQPAARAGGIGLVPDSHLAGIPGGTELRVDYSHIPKDVQPARKGVDVHRSQGNTLLTIQK